MQYKGKVYNKIIIVGSAGSGKSYLSRLIANETRQPLIHLDNEYWKPGWNATPRTEWIDRQKILTAGESWIIDGNYNSTLEVRFAAADCVIFLDMKRIMCIYSAWKRHGKKRSDLPEYLEEKMDREFFKFLKLIWKFPKKDRIKIVQLHNQYAEKQFIVLKNRVEIRKFVMDIKSGEMKADTIPPC